MCKQVELGALYLTKQILLLILLISDFNVVSVSDLGQREQTPHQCSDSSDILVHPTMYQATLY